MAASGVLSTKALKDAAIGSMVDYTLQVGLNWAFFAKDDATIEEIAKDVDFYQIAASGAENAFSSSISNQRTQVLLGAGISCMFDGSFEDGNLRKDFNLEECAKGIASAVIANQISNFALAKLQNLDAERLKRGLLRLGIPQKEWTRFLRWLGIKNADHIAEGVEKSLEELLSGLKKVVPSDQWDKFVDDFGKDAAKLAKFDANPKLVDSWKLLENSARRTDIKVLKFFDDPAVVASRQDVISRNLHKTFPDIPIEELTAIRHYSSDAYVGFNEALRKGVLTDEYKAFEELLNSGMSKLPKFNGEKVYRGCGIQESNLAHKWVIGQDIVFSDFKSTSTSMGKASKFLKGDVYYEILNPKGVNICDISCHPNELEVLFQSKAKFKVKNIKEDAVMYDEAFEPINAKKITLEFVGYE